MRKEYSTNRMILVSFTQDEFEQFQDFINSPTFDQSLITDRSTHKFFTDFCRKDDIHEFDSIISKINHRTSYFGDLVFETDYEKSITSSNTEDSFFINSTISDISLIQYAGSNLSIGMMDRLRIESFIYDNLGVPAEHKINWSSPLLGVLSRYLRENKTLGNDESE